MSNISDPTLEKIRLYVRDDNVFNFYVEEWAEREVGETIVQFLIELQLPQEVYDTRLVYCLEYIRRYRGILHFNLTPFWNSTPTVQAFDSDHSSFSIDPDTGLITWQKAYGDRGTIDPYPVRQQNGWCGPLAQFKWRPGFEGSLPSWVKAQYLARLGV